MIYCAFLPLQLVVFGINDGPTGALFVRYIEKQGVHDISFNSSGVTSVNLPMDEDRAKQLIRSFDDEYGVTMEETFPSHLVKDLPYPLTFDPKPGVGLACLSDFDKDSLLVKAFRQLAEAMPEVNQEEIVACRYCIRPYLTQNLKRTETVSVIFTVLVKGKRFDYHAIYDPWTGLPDRFNLDLRKKSNVGGAAYPVSDEEKALLGRHK